MQKKYSNIRLLFKNREAVSFPARAVTHFIIGGITKTISQVNNGAKENHYEEIVRCAHISLVLNQEANDVKRAKACFEKTLPFDRICKAKDIWAIELDGKDGTHRFLLPWKGSTSENELQTVHCDSAREIMIVGVGHETETFIRPE